MRVNQGLAAVAIVSAVLTGCSLPYVQPSDGPTATVRFANASAHRAKVWLYSDADACSVRYDAATLAQDSSAQLKVPAAEELAVTFRIGWQSYDGRHSYTCAITSGFVPEPGAAYRMELRRDGSGCNLLTTREDAADADDTRRRTIQTRQIKLRDNSSDGSGHCVSDRGNANLGAYFRQPASRAESEALLDSADRRLEAKDVAGGIADLTEAARLGNPNAFLRLCRAYSGRSNPPALWVQGYAWCSVALDALPESYIHYRNQAAQLWAGLRGLISDQQYDAANAATEELLRTIRAR